MHFQSRRSGRRRWPLVAVGVAVAGFLAASAVLFVWPSSGPAGPAGAILSLDGPLEKTRTSLAVSLAEKGLAPVLLYSMGAVRTSGCPVLTKVRVVCFNPHPARTVGEITFAARYAREHGIDSLLIVAGHAQTSRARLLAHRCYPGRATVIASHSPWWHLPYEVVYEWGAMAKALFVDSGCS